MADAPHEILGIRNFLATSRVRRAAIVHELVEILGPDWESAALVGEQGMCCLHYAPLDSQFVLVPGGEYRMGFRNDDREAFARVADLTEERTRDLERYLLEHCRPVHPVRVAPHLFGRITCRRLKC